MASRQRIIIFGGSFDPPTRAHEAIIRACLALPGFDAVWVMPSCNRADKAIATSDAKRLDMLNVVRSATFSDTERLVISDVEVRLGPPTQLRRTLAELSRTHPDTEFWFAFGGDSYRDIANWEGAVGYMSSLRMIVFTEYLVPTSDQLMHLHLPANVQDASSSQVRAALAQRLDTSDWLSDPVRQYTLAHQLYA